VIEPNRLAAPGERAALERVEAVVEAIDGLHVDLVAISPGSLLDPDEHAALIAELEMEADRSGRRELLELVRDRVRSALSIRVAQPTRFDPVVRYAITPQRPEDAAATVLTVTDAVAVAVMQDRLDTAAAARLAGPGRALLGLPPLGDPRAEPGPAPVPEPTAADWADAETGGAMVTGDARIPVGVRVGVATVTAAVLGPVAVFEGMRAGQAVPGILAGLAVVAVCWLVATYRR
jgi:hypothetical protein